jgi:hypothetical protein
MDDSTDDSTDGSTDDSTDDSTDTSVNDGTVNVNQLISGVEATAVAFAGPPSVKATNTTAPNSVTVKTSLSGSTLILIVLGAAVIFWAMR